MRVLQRFVLLLALMQQRDVVSAFVATPLFHTRSAGVHGLVVPAAARSLSCEGGKGKAQGRGALRLQMKGASRTAISDVGGSDLGKRPTGPDPFNKVQGDMQSIKSKIKRIADRAMSSSSKFPPRLSTPLCCLPDPLRLLQPRRSRCSFVLSTSPTADGM
jgi:hypothetical protein